LKRAIHPLFFGKNLHLEVFTGLFLRKFVLSISKFLTNCFFQSLFCYFLD